MSLYDYVEWNRCSPLLFLQCCSWTIRRGPSDCAERVRGLARQSLLNVSTRRRSCPGQWGLRGLQAAQRHHGTMGTHDHKLYSKVEPNTIATVSTMYSSAPSSQNGTYLYMDRSRAWRWTLPYSRISLSSTALETKTTHVGEAQPCNAPRTLRTVRATRPRQVA